MDSINVANTNTLFEREVINYNGVRCFVP